MRRVAHQVKPEADERAAVAVSVLFLLVEDGRCGAGRGGYFKHRLKFRPRGAAQSFGSRTRTTSSSREVILPVVVEGVGDGGRDEGDEGQRRQPPDVPDQGECRAPC